MCQVNYYPRKPYDSTVARIAGKIISGWRPGARDAEEAAAVAWAVRLARKIVAEVERTEATGRPTVVRQMSDFVASTIEQTADGHYRRGLGGEIVRANWFKLAEGIRAEITNQNAIRHTHGADK